MKNVRVVLLLLLAFASACGQQKKITDYVRQQDIDSAEFFSDSVTEFAVDVYYEASAAPFTGPLTDSPERTWAITRQSFIEVFKTHVRRKVSVPQDLPAMRAIPDNNIVSWDEKQLMALSKSLDTPPVTGRATAKVIFIKGNYQGQSTVLGIHFSGVKTAFVFKDGITLFAGGIPFQQRIEQATVVHELGHVIGLVNNGVPMVAPHEDSEHPHHTTDPDDVMYWDLISTATRSDRLILFGKKTLDDAHAFHRP